MLPLHFHDCFGKYQASSARAAIFGSDQRHMERYNFQMGLSVTRTNYKWLAPLGWWTRLLQCYFCLFVITKHFFSRCAQIQPNSLARWIYKSWPGRHCLTQKTKVLSVAWQRRIPVLSRQSIFLTRMFVGNSHTSVTSSYLLATSEQQLGLLPCNNSSVSDATYQQLQPMLGLPLCSRPEPDGGRYYKVSRTCSCGTHNGSSCYVAGEKVSLLINLINDSIFLANQNAWTGEKTCLA